VVISDGVIPLVAGTDDTVNALHLDTGHIHRVELSQALPDGARNVGNAAAERLVCFKVLVKLIADGGSHAGFMEFKRQAVQQRG